MNPINGSIDCQNPDTGMLNLLTPDNGLLLDYILASAKSDWTSPSRTCRLKTWRILLEFIS